MNRGSPINTLGQWGKVGFTILILFVAFIALRSHSPTEPRHEGKKLSEWLTFGVESEDAMEQTSRAIQRMGTKAVPSLLTWIQSRDSKFKEKMNALLDKQSWTEFRFTDSHERQELAVAGFAYLGELGRPAVPKLATLVEDLEIGENALYSLSYIGEPAVPTLLAVANHRSVAVRVRFAEVIGDTPLRNHASLLSKLADLTYDPDSEVQVTAVRSLGYCSNRKAGPVLSKVATDKTHPGRLSAMGILCDWTTNTDLTLPVFLMGTKDTNGAIRRCAVRGLIGLGNQMDVIEFLDPLLTDPDREIRAKAVASLGQLTNRFDKVIARLRHALNDDEPVVCAAAAGGLAMLAANERMPTFEHSPPANEMSASSDMISPAVLEELFMIDGQAAEALGFKPLIGIGCGFGFHWYVPNRVIERRFSTLH
jgi:HEAT repeat protein